MTIVLPESLDLYLRLAVLFFAGYHIAYLFKNLSRFREQQGLLMFVFTLIWLFSVIAVVLPMVEASANWPITLVYLAGFSMRFFRYDY